MDTTFYTIGFAYQRFWEDVYGKKAAMRYTVADICKRLDISRNYFYKLQKKDIPLDVAIRFCIMFRLNMANYLYVKDNEEIK